MQMWHSTVMMIDDDEKEPLDDGLSCDMRRQIQ